MRSLRPVLRNQRCSTTAAPNVPPPMITKSNGRISPRGDSGLLLMSRAFARYEGSELARASSKVLQTYRPRMSSAKSVGCEPDPMFMYLLQGFPAMRCSEFQPQGPVLPRFVDRRKVGVTRLQPVQSDLRSCGRSSGQVPGVADASGRSLPATRESNVGRSPRARRSSTKYLFALRLLGSSSQRFAPRLWSHFGRTE